MEFIKASSLPGIRDKYGTKGKSFHDNYLEIIEEVHNEVSKIGKVSYITYCVVHLGYDLVIAYEPLE